MKNLIGFFICLVLASSQFIAAQVYRNEWIDYSKNYYKIKVFRDGLVKIPASTLTSAGLPTDASGYKIFKYGEEIPLHISTNNALTSNDWIEFVGKKNDSSFDQQLYDDPGYVTIPELSLFSDTASYFLIWDNATPSKRFSTIVNDLSATPAPEDFFTHTAKTLYNQTFNQGVPFRTLGGVNNYYSNFEEAEGWSSTIIPFDNSAPLTTSFYVQTPYVYSSANMEAIVDMGIIGKSNDLWNIPDHHHKIMVGNELFVEDTFEGYDMVKYNFNVPLSNIGTSSFVDNTEVKIEVINDIVQSNFFQKFAVTALRVTYPRQFNFDNQRSFAFTLDNNENKYLEINNFNGGNTPVLYDLTNNLRLVPELLNGVYRIYLPMAGVSPKREYLLTNTTSGLSVITVDALSPKQYTDFSNPDLAGDYIIISHPQLHMGDVDQVERYADYRSSADGGAYNVLVVDIEELYDQFAYGIPKHPLAIQNFSNYIVKQFNQGIWAHKPDQMLLLGRSFVYDKCLYDNYSYNKCFIPTYGNRGSDNMLSVAHKDSFLSQLATGRISAETPQNISDYLDKVITYEQVQRELDVCDPSSLWRKNFIHIGGGKTQTEVDTFLVYLNDYKKTVEDTLIGAKVLRTYNPQINFNDIQPVPDDISDVINEGLNCITYIGHSNVDYWAVDLRAPSYYENEGKYPFIYSNSCFVGNIHDEISPTHEVMAIEYALAPEKGSIGFLATVGFGFPLYLDVFSSQFYHNFSDLAYGQTIGKCIRKTINDIYYYPYTNGNNYVDGIKITSQEFTLEGDPAIRLYNFDKPEYIVEDQGITFNPPVVSAADASFQLRAIVTNTGRATNKPFKVKVSRHLPDGTTEIVFDQYLPSTKYRDTLSFTVPNTNIESFGVTTFEVAINDGDAIVETCTDNNTATKSILILPTNAIPIFPCDYAIVNTAPVTLRASSASPLLPDYQYVFQIDTTFQFNSTVLKQAVVTSKGGVIEWLASDVNYEQDRVYYWRISRVPLGGEEYDWESASFIYRNGDLDGWNQSHYYQFKRNNYLEGMNINDFTRHFEFGPTPNNVTCQNGYPPTALGWNDIRYYLNGFQMANNSCLRGPNCFGGYFFAVFKPKSELEVFQSERASPLTVTNTCDEFGVLGNIHCSSQPLVNGFEYFTGSASDFQKVSMFLDSIPTGWYILMYSIENHRSEPNPEYAPYQQEVMDKFASLGFPELSTIENDKPFICFFRKGDLSYPKELLVAETSSDILFLDKSVEGRNYHGKFDSPILGPAKSWQSLKWDFESLDGVVGDDAISVDIIGVDQNYQETFIANTGSIQDYNLLSISATQYPYLRLKAVLSDTTNFTPAQLKYWRVYFEKAPEFALDQNRYFQFFNDTLFQGELGHFGMGITNASPLSTPELHLNASITNQQGLNIELNTPPISGFQPFQSVHYDLNIPTENLTGGDYYFNFTLNPNRQQLEKQQFNNSLFIPFTVIGDQINPIIDVTFDGEHIVSGDIVSAQPEILIKIKDENLYVPLSDPSDCKVMLIHESGQEIELEVNSSNFTPAATNLLPDKNEAKIVLTPQNLADGFYDLKVSAKDMAGNFSSGNDFYTRFEIINKPMISNAVNYPNPFTTATRFIFTLTGSEVPEDLRISIFNISGKVVREISKAELGELRIGRNLSEFVWDGRDMYGNELANGVYLYTVKAANNGKELELYSSDRTSKVDEIYNSNSGFMNFKSHGIGKMYKMK